MTNLWQAMWREDDGLLSFEWVLVVTLLAIGVIGGLAAARDAIVDEFGDSAQAMVAVDQSYVIGFPLAIEIDNQVIGGATNSDYTDSAFYADCGRNITPLGQGSLSDL